MQPTVYQSLREASFHVADHLPRSAGPLAPNPPPTSSAEYRAFARQAEQALRDLVECHIVERPGVLAVTHGGLIKTLLRTIAGTDSICFRLYNSGVNLIEWRRGRWHITHINMVDHLPVALRTQ
jgi:probable phosphoglycerate mutase